MKKLLLLFLILNFTNCFSQDSKQNLFLFINQKPISEVINDSLTYQTFEINFDTKGNTTEMELKVNKNGNLENKIRVKGASSDIVIFKYLNKKSNNDPVLIKKKDVLNYLNYEDIVCCIKIGNFLETLSKFNVYIINAEPNSNQYYMAKKVSFEKYIGL